MKNYLLALLLFAHYFSHSQHNRISTRDAIGWYNVFGTVQVSKRFSLLAEYQWRRTDMIVNWQQSLLRVGVNYQLTPNVMFRVGYAWVETYPYGEIPINALGKTFTEHRVYQMAQLSHRESIVEFVHRFMFEQRFVGRYSAAHLKREDTFPLLLRLRYMLRLQIPLKGKTIADKTPYVAVYDEILVGFGRQVQLNVFDQNRVGVLMGYRFNPYFRLEGGYISQIVQLGRQVNGKPVFQYNNGLIINAMVQLDVRKKKR